MTTERSKRSVDGVVYLEFLIAFPALWVFSVCILQLVLLARADLIVRHAAQSAARSAAVVLPDDPVWYGGEPKMSVSRQPVAGVGKPATNGSQKQETARRDPLARVLRALSRPARSRRDAIATAARVPLLSLAAGSSGLFAGGPTVESSVGPTSLTSALAPQSSRLSLEFPGAVDDRVQGPEVTVLVAFDYPCSVPVARHIVCALNPKSRALDDTVWRFEHSSTLLLQDAPYEYRSAMEG